MGETMRIRKRSEIPVEDTWALEDLYATDGAWEEDLKLLEESAQMMASYAGSLSDGPEKLFGYLCLMEETNRKAERLANYAMRKGDQDTRVATYQAMSGRFMSAYVALCAGCSFETPEIMAISDEQLDSLMSAQYSTPFSP